MKVFLKKIMVFTMIPVILILSMDIWLRNQSSLYKEKFVNLFNEKDSIEVLILGDSQSNYGVDPDHLSYYAYNMASPNQSLYFDIRLTRLALDSLSNLKYVMIGLDYHSLYYSSQGIRDSWSYYANGVKYKNKGYLFENISPFLFGYTPKISLCMLEKKVINSVKYRNQQILDIIDIPGGINVRDSIYRGYIGHHGQDKTDLNKAAYMELINNFNHIISTSVEKEEIMSDLSSFIVTLRSNNIIPILFSAPSYKEYNALLDKRIVDQNRKDFNDLANKHDIIYLDYSHSTNFHFEDFYDGNHLNKKGALKFSRMLDTVINDLDIEQLASNHKNVSK